MMEWLKKEEQESVAHLVKPYCDECYHFNPAITDPWKGYRCRVNGSCPAVVYPAEDKRPPKPTE